MLEVSDLRASIIPKSDQINSDQLLTGPMTITVAEVRTSASDEQPVVVHYEGENGRPYKPCKTMRKLLILAWGEDGRQWVGRSMTIYNQPDVRFGGAEVGGIRISHLSHIPRPIQANLTSTRGKKALHTVQRLEMPAPVDGLAAIAAASSLAGLKTAYEAAFKAASTKAQRDELTAAKDLRKAALVASPPPAASEAGESVDQSTPVGLK